MNHLLLSARRFWKVQISRSKFSIQISTSFYILIAVLILILPLQLVIAWTIATIIHELAHVLAVLRCSSIDGIHISAAGIRLSTPTMTYKHELLCALCGPVSGFFLLFFYRYIPLIALCGVIQSVINLIPINERDGARVTKALFIIFLGQKKGEGSFAVLEWIIKILLQIGFVLICFRLQLWALLLCGILLQIFSGKIPCKHRRQIVQ